MENDDEQLRYMTETRRMPTPESDLYRWHSAMMRGEAQPVWEGEPQAGWFVRSYSYRGLLYPAMIFWDQPVDDEGELIGDETLRCIVVRPEEPWATFAGTEVDPIGEWLQLAKRPIPKEEYTDLMLWLMLNPNTYQGPSRPLVRWYDERERAADMLRYSTGDFHAIRTD